MKSDIVLSNEDVHIDLPQSPSYKKYNSFKFTNNNGNGSSCDVNSTKTTNNNNNKKQDKLNRLLQELKDYSQDNHVNSYGDKNGNYDNQNNGAQLITNSNNNNNNTNRCKKMNNDIKNITSSNNQLSNKTSFDQKV